MPDRARRLFGANKYAALHLLLARWIRNVAPGPRFDYVTLGGTELRDVLSLAYVDKDLVTNATSYERDPGRHRLATAAAIQLRSRVPITVLNGSLFDTDRIGKDPHIFFVDLEGACEGADFPERFANLLQREVLREGDALFITSYLGRNRGYARIFERYDGEFRVLGIADADAKRRTYRRAHPSFTLFRALARADLTQELHLRCFGCVDYRDSSPMGLFGYSLHPGATSLPALVADVPYFNMSRPTET